MVNPPTLPHPTTQNGAGGPGGPGRPGDPAQGVLPGPLPTQIGIRPVMYGQEKMVVLEISTPFGTVFPHMTLDAATQLGQALTQITASGRTGLVLPPSARL